MEWFDAFIVVFASGMRLAVPLILACLAGLWSERSGIVDIGLEGKILVGAFASAAVATFTGSVWLGLLAGVAAAIVVSLIHGYASIDQRANQIVSGTAINMVADGLTALIGNAIWSQGGRTPQLPETAQFREIALPFVSADRRRADHRADLSGPDFRPRPDRLHRLRAWCPSPTGRSTARASDCVCGRSARIRPRSTPPAFRCAACAIARSSSAGSLVGLAGVYLALGQTGYFQPHMSAGRGFIALAALVFAKWRPWPALATCLLFGFLDALAIRLQGVELPVIGPVPVQAIEALPYILTVVLLAGFIGKAIPPRASGIPYVKER